MNSATSPLTRGEFETRLLAAADRYPFEETRLAKLLATGRCPPSMVRGYAEALHKGSYEFNGLLAALVEAAPDREARGILLDNLLEEEGIVVQVGRGLVAYPQSRHVAWAERFLRACGGAPPSDGHAAGDKGLPAGRVAELLKDGRWLEAVSFLLIGMEMNFGKVCALLSERFSGLGYAARDLVFFEAHTHADEKHAREALDIVLDRAVDLAAQQACLDAAQAGARDWWLRHGGRAPS